MQPTWTDGRPTEEAAADFVKPNDRLTSFERLEIYNRQYWYRLLDSLYEDFPGLRTLLGDDRFRKMCVAYLEKYPSRSFTLRDLGDRLERFLSRHPEWTAPHRRLARDLVRLEWAHIVAFDGDERPPLEPDALLGNGDPARLRLHFQPFLTFLACDHAVDDFILKVRRRVEPRGEASNAVAEETPRQAATSPDLPPVEKIYLAVHRSDYSIFYKRMEPEAYRLCVALRKGLNLQDACDYSMGRRKMDPAFPDKLQNWFAQWAAFGWFCQPQ